MKIEDRQLFVNILKVPPAVPTHPICRMINKDDLSIKQGTFLDNNLENLASV